MDKLFLKFDYIVVTEEDYIYGENEKEGKRELLAPDSTEAFSIVRHNSNRHRFCINI